MIDYKTIDNEIDALEYLENLDKSYYTGTSIVPDSTYDTIRDYLNEKFNLNYKVGYIVPDNKNESSAWIKESLSLPMGSLLKINNIEDGIAWAKKYTRNKNLVASYKADGSSLEITYIDGQFVKAITRGDGFTGENITKNAANFKFPKSIVHMGIVHIRGEVIIKLEDFADHFKGEKSARNSTAGTMRRFDSKNSQHVSFLAFDIIISNKEFKFKHEKFLELSCLGFQVPYIGMYKNIDEVVSVFQSTEKNRSLVPYEIDGIVVEENEIKFYDEQGIVDNRPRAARAFKFGNQLAESVLLDVQWQTGKTGEVTPVGIIKPTTIQGVTINRVTLNNYQFIKDLGLGEGSIITITRANDVIPKIEACLSAGINPISMPTHCPACSNQLDSRDLMHIKCNNDNCKAKNIARILHFIKTLDILGLGESTIESLFDNGFIDDIPDLFNLDFYYDQIEQTEGLSLTNIKKAEIELVKKTKEIPVEKFLAAIFIPSCSLGTAKLVTSKFPTLNDIFFIQDPNELTDIEGIGLKTAQDFLSGFKMRTDLINTLLKSKNITLLTKKIMLKKEGKFSGQFYCFTGLRDKQLENEIEIRGGEITSSVTKKTTHLICDSLESGSSKITKAKSMGLVILDVDTFTKSLL